MPRKYRYLALVLVCAAAFRFVLVPLLQQNAGTDDRPFLHPLFSSDAVLQQGRSIPIWGWTRPGATVSVELGDQTAGAVAGDDGRWQVTIAPLPLGAGPLTLAVTGPQSAISTGIWAGEVWLCAGQSNMNWRLRESDDGEAMVHAGGLSRLRLYHPENWWWTSPIAASPKSGWSPATTQRALDFSGVGMSFALELQKRFPDRRIGLIQTAYDGATAEAFLSREDVAAFGGFEAELAAIDRARPLVESGAYRADAALSEFRRNHGTLVISNDVAAVPLPDGLLARLAATVRRTIITSVAIEAPGTLSASVLFGPIRARDRVYVNGVLVGQTEQSELARTYDIPSGILVPGGNTIAVILQDERPGDGPVFADHGSELRIGVREPYKISLQGGWHALSPDDGPAIPPVPDRYVYPMEQPSLVWNFQVHPIVGFPLAGVLWYQGESNVSRPRQYARLLPHLIDRWRSAWRDPDLAFLIVQLAGSGDRSRDPPQGDALSDLMQVQSTVQQSGHRLGLACAYDLGTSRDLHPTNKREVGRRLVFPALSIVYGKSDTAAGGPILRDVSRHGSTVHLRFDQVATGLKWKAGASSRFCLSGPDGRRFWAQAEIQGIDQVEVTSPMVPNPREVRLNIENFPPATLINSEDLPAIPFQVVVPPE